MSENRILVNFVGDHVSWTDVYEYLRDDLAIITWEQPTGLFVAGLAGFHGDIHQETGEKIWDWDGDFVPVKKQ